MAKKERLNDIIKLINEYEIDTQEELTKRLVDLGYNVSQATVSRDINELSLIKTSGLKKKFKYSVMPIVNSDIPDSLKIMIQNSIVSVLRANNLIVVKTISGNANAIANCFDQINLKNVLGTIAGDDTLLMVSDNDLNAEAIVKSIKGIINA